MTAPNLVSLKQAGDAVMMHVTRCGPVGVGNFPEIEFGGVDGGREVVVQMPKSSADRQLARLNLAYSSIIGKIITISRDPNKTKPSAPYWGISLNGDAPIEKPTNGTPIVQATQERIIEPVADDRTAKLKAVFTLQELAFTHALKLAAVAEKAGIPPTFEGVSALTAQALIEASRRGVA